MQVIAERGRSGASSAARAVVRRTLRAIEDVVSGTRPSRARYTAECGTVESAPMTGRSLSPLRLLLVTLAGWGAP